MFTINLSNAQRLVLLALIFTLSFNATAYGKEKPLKTINENNPEPSHISSPFKSDNSFQSDSALSAPGESKQNNVLSNPQVPAAQVEPQIEALKNVSGKEYKNLLGDPTNPIGLAYPYQELEKSKEFLKKKDTLNAKKIVEPLTEWLTTLTEYHIELFKKLSSIGSAKNQAQIEKKIALDSALLRDKAYYQLGLIYLAENDSKKAIKYFVDVIKSQPQTELGMKAYEILQEIGFTEKIRLVD